LTLPPSDPKRTFELIAFVTGGVVVPVVTSFFLPALPENIRVPVGIGVGAILLIVAAAVFLRLLRRIFASEASRVRDALEGYTVEPRNGRLFKGRIRNVALRTSTLHDLLDEVLKFVPDERRKDALYSAGYTIGQSWAADLETLSHDLDDDAGDIDAKLALWARYDATGGMGALDIKVTNEGLGTVSLKYSFLSDQPSCLSLNYWFAGYIAGTLEHILGTPVTVQLTNPSIHRQIEAHFSVSPASVPASDGVLSLT
jgi:hypothetical protein